MKTFILLALFSFSALSATSLEERAMKKVELTYQVGVDYRLSPSQGSIMYFMNPNDLIGLKAGSDSEGDSSQTNFALQYKHYFANSYYMATEFFYLNTREDVNKWNILFLEDEYANYKSLGAGIRIGNQWTWRYFTLGVDWIGIGARFGTFEKETDELDEFTFTLGNVIIGVSF